LVAGRAAHRPLAAGDNRGSGATATPVMAAANGHAALRDA